MKLSIQILSLCVLSFLSLPAHAEEVVYGEKEYSTVETEGQLVPVGERNKYQLTYKTWNIWTNPFTWFFGSYGFGVSYAFHPNFKLNFAPDFVYTFNRDDRLMGFGTTISSSIFFKKVYDGLYLEPGMRFGVVEEDNEFTKDEVTVTVGPQLILGWGFVWDSGFTTNVGFGLGYSWTNGGEFNEYDYYDGIYAAGNLQFGYSF